MNPDLVTICISAFIAVFILLTTLSGIMAIINAIFPENEEDSDLALFAAVTTTVNNVYPNSKITHIEEVK